MGWHLGQGSHELKTRLNRELHGSEHIQSKGEELVLGGLDFLTYKTCIYLGCA